MQFYSYLDFSHLPNQEARAQVESNNNVDCLDLLSSSLWLWFGLTMLVFTAAMPLHEV